MELNFRKATPVNRVPTTTARLMPCGAEYRIEQYSAKPAAVITTDEGRTYNRRAMPAGCKLFFKRGRVEIDLTPPRAMLLVSLIKDNKGLEAALTSFVEAHNSIVDQA